MSNVLEAFVRLSKMRMPTEELYWRTMNAWHPAVEKGFRIKMKTAPMPVRNVTAADTTRAYGEVLNIDLNATPIVHVAGTKGKGSTTAMTSQALLSGGMKVGTYTSPHLQRVEERVAVDGVPLDADVFLEAFHDVVDRLWTARAALEAKGLPPLPPFFQMMTLVAFGFFPRAGLDALVVEAGVGGRKDATNAVDNKLATVLTAISNDHLDVIGPGLEDVAREKLGICRPGIPLITPPQSFGLDDIIKAHAAAETAPLTVTRPTSDPRLENARLAHAAASTVLGHPPPVAPEGLTRHTPQGRFTVRQSGDCVYYIDGAHNGASMRHAMRWFESNEAPESSTLAFFCYPGKQLSAMLPILARPWGDVRVVVPTPKISPGCPMEALMDHDGAEGWSRELAGRVGRAMGRGGVGVGLEGVKGPVLVTGSLHLVGSVMSTLE